MLDKFDGTTRIVLSILLFPLFFQEEALMWVWGSADDLVIAVIKRTFLLLPVAAIVGACWLTIASLLTVIVRQRRREFVSTLVITWWDLGRAIFTFWGGFFKFIFYLVGWLVALARVGIFGLWISFQDVVLFPFRAIKGVGDIAARPGVPWIAVWMTVSWCALEAFIFTFVMTSLVIDTLGNLTGVQLAITSTQIILYFLLLGFILGSYAIMSSLSQAIAQRNIKQVIFVFIVEVLAMTFEVLFLYREFVDALVPWFAQHAGEGFTMSPFVIIGLAGMIWAGIRAMTWFLFASAGTPTIMAIVQRTGLGESGDSPMTFRPRDHLVYIQTALNHIKTDLEWCHRRGDEALSALILPPLQVVGAFANFCTLLISAKHLFDLPFNSFRDLLVAKDLVNRVKDE